jgi:hypothetical protein
MEKIIILKNEYATLWYYPEEKIIHHEFHKLIFGENFRNILSKGADVFIEKGCTKWLSDDRKTLALRKEDIDWSNPNWRPRIIDAGWKYWAILMPEKNAGKVNFQCIIDMFSMESISIKIFKNNKKALNWLIKSK